MPAGECMKYVILLVIWCFIIGCKANEPLFHDYDHYHTYFWGFYNQLSGNHTIAQNCFNTILKNDGPLYAYEGLLYHLYETKKFDDITALMKNVDKTLEDNLDVQLIFAKVLEITGRHQEAEQKIVLLYEKFKTNQEVVYGCANVHIRHKNLDKALYIIKDYLESVPERPSCFIFHYMTAQIYITLYQTEKAQEALKKCLELNPTFDQGWLFSGFLHELQGNLDAAITGYKTYLSLVGSDKQIEQQLLNVVMKQSGQPSNSLQKTFEAAINLYRQHQFAHALQLIESCLTQQPTYRPARLLKLELLTLLNRNDQALKELQTWIQQEPEEDIWYRSAYLMYQAGIAPEKITQLYQNLIDKNTQNLSALLYLSDIYLKQKNSTQAAQLLKKALPLARDPLLKVKVLYQLGMIYFNNKQYEALQQIIDEGFKQNTFFAPLWNLAAYYYATKKHNTKKAQQLINKVLETHKDNPHYLDTQALIWYKEKRYQKAYDLLSKLSEKFPHDFFIQKHLGKTLYKLGKPEQALAIVNNVLKKQCSPYEHEKCIQLVKKWDQQKK